jgi:hypothetical protein
LNTLSAPLMVDPNQLADGDHHVLSAATTPKPRAQVSVFLRAELLEKTL